MPYKIMITDTDTGAMTMADEFAVIAFSERVENDSAVKYKSSQIVQFAQEGHPIDVIEKLLHVCELSNEVTGMLHDKVIAIAKANGYSKILEEREENEQEHN